MPKRKVTFHTQACSSPNKSKKVDVTQHSACINNLPELKALQKELEEKNETLSKSLLEIESLTEKNRKYREHLEKGEGSNSEQLSTIRSSFETQLQDRNRLVDALQDTITNLQIRINKLEGGGNPPSSGDSLKHLFGEIRLLQDEKEELAAQLVKCRSESEGSQTDHRSTVSQLQETIARLQAGEGLPETEMVSELGSCSTDTEKELKKLQVENKKIHLELMYTSQIQDLKRENDQLKKEMASLVDELSHTHVESRQQSVEQQQKLTLLQKENCQVSRQMRKLQADVAFFASKEPEVVSTADSTQMKSEEILKSLDKLKSENHRLQYEFLKSEAEWLQLKKQIELEAADTERKNREIVEDSQNLKVNNEKLTVEYRQLSEKLVTFNKMFVDLVVSYGLLKKLCESYPQLIKETLTLTKLRIDEKLVKLNNHTQELVKKYYKEMALRKKYHNELVQLKGNIRTFCRIRPRNHHDNVDGGLPNSVVSHDSSDVIYVNHRGKVHCFEMEKVFGENSTQKEIFDEVRDLVTSCIDGYNVCIFAYGQTGSGKTFTMEGSPDDPGINKRALEELFREISKKDDDWHYNIEVSMLEIYNEMLHDLLANDSSSKLEIKYPDGKLHIPGLSSYPVKSVEQVNQVFTIGQKNRATASTDINEHSSRSHALLCVTVVGVNKTTRVKAIGKLNLVDLAGSERVSKSGADGLRLKEAQNINKSLACLGDVIHSLQSKQSHIPYRNSKLTYLLQDSLGGESKTLVIVQVAPVEEHVGETICSLLFAQRACSVELGTAKRRLEAPVGDMRENGDASPSLQSSPARRYSSCRESPKSASQLFKSPSAVQPRTPKSAAKSLKQSKK